MATTHISEAEAIRDIKGLLARAYNGEEIVIVKDPASPAAVLRPAVAPSLRRLSESLSLAKEHGSKATLDGGFASDLEAAVNSHPERLISQWD